MKAQIKRARGENWHAHLFGACANNARPNALAIRKQSNKALRIKTHKLRQIILFSSQKDAETKNPQAFCEKAPSQPATLYGEFWWKCALVAMRAFLPGDASPLFALPEIGGQ
jgi:hypothetical protein